MSLKKIYFVSLREFLSSSIFKLFFIPLLKKKKRKKNIFCLAFALLYEYYSDSNYI